MAAYGSTVRKLVALLLLATLSVTSAWIWLANRPSEIEKAVMSAAEAGAFPLATGNSYDGHIDCRVSEPNAFHQQDLFLCKLGLNGLGGLGGQYVYAAMLDGELHTHDTDPGAIPGRVFDPGF